MKEFVVYSSVNPSGFVVKQVHLKKICDNLIFNKCEFTLKEIGPEVSVESALGNDLLEKQKIAEIIADRNYEAMSLKDLAECFLFNEVKYLVENNSLSELKDALKEIDGEDDFAKEGWKSILCSKHTVGIYIYLPSDFCCVYPASKIFTVS